MTAGQDIVSTGEEIDGILKNLNNIIDAINGTWSGAAKDAFTVLNTRFDEDARKLNEALKEIAEQVTGSANLYVQQQEEQAQQMSSITSRLG
ncbi:MAG: WXG100 family type VII secretion target [Umezawaea sp.]|uniref:WXG100 family type VII secretion target n=1 Tax=Umezawaea tangerina TaxID=84725 RepID=UPI001FE856D4|nr:WXG100 family type VII secretion target [Umezawaea tangerina]